jgi:hypothetical protein
MNNKTTFRVPLLKIAPIREDCTSTLFFFFLVNLSQRAHGMLLPSLVVSRRYDTTCAHMLCAWRNE